MLWKFAGTFFLTLFLLPTCQIHHSLFSSCSRGVSGTVRKGQEDLRLPPSPPRHVKVHSIRAQRDLESLMAEAPEEQVTAFLHLFTK